jgi:nucleotide-binding universal stress UspA family protein
MYAPTGRALSLLDQGRRIASDAAPEVAVRLSVVDGVAGPALVTTSRRAHLLVLGARDLAGSLELTLGRTLVHTMGHAACPVVVVPAHWGPEDRHAGPVLAAVDGSPESHGAVAFAIDVADRWRARISAISALPRGATDAEDDARRRVLAEARAGSATSHPGLRIHEVVRHGTPSAEILAVARDRAALVVVGSRGRGAVVGPLIGSTSQAVVRAAPCPIAVLSSAAAARWASPQRVWAEEGV